MRMSKAFIMAILLVPGLAFAANLPEGAKLEQFDDFSGGLNTRTAPHKLPKNQTPNAENGLIDEVPGSIVERNGMSLAGRNPYLSKVSFQFEFFPETGDRGLFQSDGGTLTYTTDMVNYTVIKNTFTTTAKLRAAQGRGFAMFTNKQDTVLISSGFIGIPLDGLNGRPLAPRGAFPFFYQERFFLYSSTSNPSDLHWSEQSSTAGYVIPLTDIYMWPWSNQLIIGDGDGSEGSGADVYKGQPRLHKYNKSIYTLYGIDETDYNARRTNAHSGTIANESIVQSDNFEYYLQKNGVEMFDSADSIRISDDIFPDIEDIVINSQATESMTISSMSGKM